MPVLIACTKGARMGHGLRLRRLNALAAGGLHHDSAGMTTRAFCRGAQEKNGCRSNTGRDWVRLSKAEIGSTEFLNRMQLTAMTVYPDGSFEFWHDDGDIFWGHSILVSGSLAKGVTDASIAG